MNNFEYTSGSRSLGSVPLAIANSIDQLFIGQLIRGLYITDRSVVLPYVLKASPANIAVNDYELFLQQIKEELSLALSEEYKIPVSNTVTFNYTHVSTSTIQQSPLLAALLSLLSKKPSDFTRAIAQPLLIHIQNSTSSITFHRIPKTPQERTLLLQLSVDWLLLHFNMSEGRLWRAFACITFTSNQLPNHTHYLPLTCLGNLTSHVQDFQDKNYICDQVKKLLSYPRKLEYFTGTTFAELAEELHKYVFDEPKTDSTNNQNNPHYFLSIEGFSLGDFLNGLCDPELLHMLRSTIPMRFLSLFPLPVDDTIKGHIIREGMIPLNQEHLFKLILASAIEPDTSLFRWAKKLALTVVNQNQLFNMLERQLIRNHLNNNFYSIHNLVNQVPYRSINQPIALQHLEIMEFFDRAFKLKTFGDLSFHLKGNKKFLPAKENEALFGLYSMALHPPTYFTSIIPELVYPIHFNVLYLNTDQPLPFLSILLHALSSDPKNLFYTTLLKQLFAHTDARFISLVMTHLSSPATLKIPIDWMKLLVDPVDENKLPAYPTIVLSDTEYHIPEALIPLRLYGAASKDGPVRNRAIYAIHEYLKNPDDHPLINPSKTCIALAQHWFQILFNASECHDPETMLRLLPINSTNPDAKIHPTLTEKIFVKGVLYEFKGFLKKIESLFSLFKKTQIGLGFDIFKAYEESLDSFESDRFLLLLSTLNETEIPIFRFLAFFILSPVKSLPIDISAQPEEARKIIRQTFGEETERKIMSLQALKEKKTGYRYSLAYVLATQQSIFKNDPTIKAITPPKPPETIPLFGKNKIPETVRKFFIDKIFENQEPWLSILRKNNLGWCFKHSFININFFVEIAKSIAAVRKPERAKEIFQDLLSFFPFLPQNNQELPSELSTLGNGHFRLVSREIEAMFLQDGFFAQDKHPLLLSLKILEIKTRISTEIATAASILQIIPCLISKRNTLQAEILQALFLDDELVGFTRALPDVSNKFLEEHRLTEEKSIVPLSEKQLKTLIHLLRETKEKVPAFLLLEEKTTKPSASNSSATSKTSSGQKRILDPAEKEYGTPAKKRQRPLTTAASQSLTTSSTTVKKVAPTLLELDHENLWRNMGINTATLVSSILEKRTLKKHLFKDTAHDYPILTLLNNGIPPVEVTILNSHLKPYQVQEVKKQLQFMQKGISRLLSFEMGLGKTYVMAELVAQLIAKGNEGLFLFVVPKTIKTDLRKNLEGYFSQVALNAAHQDYLRTEDINKPSFIVRAVESIRHALSCVSARELFGLLAIISYIDHKKLYSVFLEEKIFSEKRPSFWSELNRLSTLFLAAFEKATINQIMKGLESQAPSFYLENDSLAIQRWSEQVKKSDFIWNIQVEDPFLLFAQLIFTAKLIRRALLEKKELFLSPSFETLPLLTNSEAFTILQPESLKDVEELLALKRNKGILICHYEMFIKCPLTTILDQPWAGLFFDEAQRLHTSDSNAHKETLRRISPLKEKNPLLPLFVSTATPLENNIGELFNLLAFANPGKKGFNPQQLAQLVDRIETLQKNISALSEMKTPKDSDYVKVSEQLLLTFSHLEAFRKKIYLPLVGRKKMSDNDVKASWGENGPVKVERIATATLSDEAKNAAKIALEHFHSKGTATNKRDLLEYSHRIKRVLLHPSFQDASFSEDAGPIAEMEKTFSSRGFSEIKKRWLLESPYLSNLFTVTPESTKNNLHTAPITFSLPEMKEAARRGESGIIFVEHLKTASVLRGAIELCSTTKWPIETRVLKGEREETTKTETIHWFQSASKCAKIMVSLIGVGSIGLNFPKASFVLFLDINWNPSIDAQAAARILRVNATGQKNIIYMHYDTYFHHHAQSIRDVKKTLEDFLNNISVKTLTGRLELFKKYIIAELFQTHLNQIKNFERANSLKEDQARLISDLLNSLDEQDLEHVLKSVMPN